MNDDISARLNRIAKMGHLPFDLDFLRALGFRFGEDWDGEVLIEPPAEIDVDAMSELVRRFAPGIKQRLHFEGQKAKAVCVGGPKNGQPYYGFALHRPLLFHLARAQWVVYRVKSYDDPRAWYVGMATSRKKAQQLWAAVERTKKETS